MFPAISARVKASRSVSVPPNPSLPLPTSTTYSLSLCIFIDEAWQCPNSNIASDIWYAHPTLKNKNQKKKEEKKGKCTLASLSKFRESTL